MKDFDTRFVIDNMMSPEMLDPQPFWKEYLSEHRYTIKSLCEERI